MFLDEDGNVIEYDEDGEPIEVRDRPNKKMIEPLPIVYHSEIDYPDFEKNFYREHEAISNLTDEEVQNLRGKLNIRVSGFTPPKPVSSFGHLNFDDKLMSVIRLVALNAEEWFHEMISRNVPRNVSRNVSRNGFTKCFTKQSTFDLFCSTSAVLH